MQRNINKINNSLRDAKCLKAYFLSCFVQCFLLTVGPNHEKNLKFELMFKILNLN